MCCEQEIQMQLMHSQTLTDLRIPTLLTLSVGWNGYTLLSVSRPPQKKKKSLSHGTVLFFFVVKCLFIFYIESGRTSTKHDELFDPCITPGNQAVQ